MLHSFRSAPPRVSPSMLARHAAPSPASPPPVRRQALFRSECRTGWDWATSFVERAGERGRRDYAWWTKRRGSTPGWDRWMAEFEGFAHEALYRIDADMMDAVLAGGMSHALGDVQKEAEHFAGIADWSPPVPFVYMFHSLLEELGRVPLWDDVVAFLDIRRRDMLLAPFEDHYGLERGSCRIEGGGPYMDGLRFRTGKAYYSFFRELHVIARLRTVHGVDVRYHWLVDSEWRADLVAGNVLAELYIRNPRYKGEASGRRQGRKITCATKNPGYAVVDSVMEARRVYGVAWIAEDSEIERVARELVDSGAPRL